MCRYVHRQEYRTGNNGGVPVPLSRRSVRAWVADMCVDVCVDLRVDMCVDMLVIEASVIYMPKNACIRRCRFFIARKCGMID